MSPRVAVLVGLSTREGAVIRFVLANRGDDAELPVDVPVSGAGAIRLAFLDDGSLVVARGSALQRIGANGAVVWALDAGAPYVIDKVVAAGERIALIAARPNERETIAQLDHGCGALGDEHQRRRARDRA